MSKTRKQLEAMSVDLNGPIVPDWFKIQSDGCSVPTGLLSRVLDAEQTRAACVIHDFEYYLINLLCTPGSIDRKHFRQLADTNLRWNRVRIGKRRGFIRGHIFGRLYFRGVRLGGSKALDSKIGKIPRPPNIVALDGVEGHCKLMLLGQPIPKYGMKQIKTWRKQLGGDT